VPVLRFQLVLRIASRNFLRFRLQAVLMIVATITGTAGVIVSTGYAAGGQQKILDQFAQLGANVIIVTPQQSRAVGGRARTGSVVTTLNESDYKAIVQSVAGISSSSPTVSTTLRARAGDLTKNTAVVGCNADYFAIKHWTVTLGSLFDESALRRQQPRIALLGATAARDLFGDSDPTGSRITVNRVPFTVEGVLAERGQGLDSSNEDDQVYVPLDTAMHRLMNIDYFNSIVFNIDNWPSMDSTADQIHQILEKRHRRATSSGDDFVVQNRRSLIDTQLSAFSRLTFLVRWIALSALVVSSLGLFAVTWIGIRNRTREVGTRRAIGATRRDILVQFFAEGSLGALVGCSSGVAVAYVALRFIDGRVPQPFLFSATDAFLETLTSTALYSAFALISSLRAIRIRPMVALRAE
jgi:putative ABC transport system permease protein